MSEIQRRRRLAGFPPRTAEEAQQPVEAQPIMQRPSAVPQPNIQPGIPPQVQQGMGPRGLAAATQGLIPAESPVRTAEEEQAYNLGAKMGAQAPSKSGTMP